MITLLKTTSQSKSKSHSYKVMQRDLPHRTIANLFCQSLIFGINWLSWFYPRTKINHSICKCLLLNQNTGNSRWANFSPDRGRAVNFHSSLLWFDELDAWHGCDFRCCFCALITWRHVNLRREIRMRKKKSPGTLWRPGRSRSSLLWLPAPRFSVAGCWSDCAARQKKGLIKNYRRYNKAFIFQQGAINA